MAQLIVEQIVSVDGYAADTDGGIDFFVNAQAINEADSAQLRLLERVQAIVLGRITYTMFADYWPQADPAQEPVATPLNTIPKFVVSNTLQRAPWGANDEATVLRGDAVASIRTLRRQVAGDIIVWGSLSLTDALLLAGEVDVLRLRSVPVLLGDGRSFTPAGLDLTDMTLHSVHHYPQGVVVMEDRTAGARHARR